MNRITFNSPYAIFEKCDCNMQVPIAGMKVKKEKEGYLLSYTAKCAACGKEIAQSLHITEEIQDFADHINAFKILPALKDELAVVKLDTVKGKVREGDIFLYGNYQHLRFFDNKIQDDILVIDYSKS
ncbi:MAG: hypothetical protein HGA49_04980 [Eubacteriaceae bacterium]|nr:hypothetical protein [Eubacteriaceae bacterium]